MRYSADYSMRVKINKTISLLALLAFIGTISFLLPQAGPYLVLDQRSARADAIVILMGSIPDRFLAAVDAYNMHYAEKILIVEENMLGLNYLREMGYDVHTNSEQCASLLIQVGVSEEQIVIISGNARSTLMEAQAIKKWLSDHPQTDTLLLVSSASHMRRAHMIFDHILNHKASHQIVIFTYPSKYSGYNASKWYASKEDIQTTLSEYLKMLSFIFVERWRNQT